MIPDVTGLDADEARQAMLDAGVALDAIEVQPVEYAGESDRIVMQEPEGGEPLEAETRVTLGSSTAATMPDAVGSSEQQARRALIDLGAEVAIETAFSADAGEGTVLRSEPSAGSPLEGSVTLIVAEPSSSVFLSDLRAIQPGCSPASPRLEGNETDDGLECRLSGDRSRSLTYALDPSLTEFSALVGIDDRSPGADPASFEISLDGEPVETADVSLGEPATLSVPIEGASQLEISVIRAPGGDDPAVVDAVLADARLVGGRQIVDQLVAQDGR